MLRVERARDAHADRWIAMRAALWPDPIDEHRRAVHAALAQDDRRHAAFVAIDGDAVTGFAEASIRHDPVNGCDTTPVAFLEGLYVEPAQRRSGVARALCRTVEAWGADAGCTELGSDTDCANRDGIAFHAGSGFTETERVIFFRKPI